MEIEQKKNSLYPPAKEINKFGNEKWIDDEEEEYKDIQIILTISQAMSFSLNDEN